MKRIVPTQRPHTDDFVGNPEAFVAAMRTFRGLGYRKLAATVGARVRGKHRRGSENYLYRLCNGHARLRPELIDGLARALELSDAEARFLQASLRRDRDAAPADKAARAKASRKLLRVLAGKSTGTADVAPIKALIDPLVIAVYTLIARGDLHADAAARLITARATGGDVKKAAVRDALALLLATGAVELDSHTGCLRQTHPDMDLAVHLKKGASEAAKSEALKIYYAALDAWGTEALFDVARELRLFQSMTFLVPGAQLPALNRELAEAWREAVTKIRTKYQSTHGDVVYHAGLRAWPMLDLASPFQGEKP
jgi:hypothetical protein